MSIEYDLSVHTSFIFLKRQAVSLFIAGYILEQSDLNILKSIFFME